MINLKEIKDIIVSNVTSRVCERFSLTPDEVKVNFKSDGDLSVTLTPHNFLEGLSASVEIKENEVQSNED